MIDHDPICDTAKGDGSPCSRQGYESVWGRMSCRLHANVLRRRVHGPRRGKQHSQARPVLSVGSGMAA